MNLIVASQNLHKVQEISDILKNTGFTVKGMAEMGIWDDIIEDGKTLHENASIKANYLFNLLQENIFSEDSGLFVNALRGEPGVHTARYAGDHKNNEDNINLLLQNLAALEDRSAYFMTVICMIENGKEHYFEGKIHGNIALQKSGSGGFGYDPIFIPNGYDKTFAELSSEIKSEISHRANAVNAMLQFINRLSN